MRRKTHTSTVKLFVMNDTGSDPIQSPEAFINDELPIELREVFFTDGDRALSFIEADVAISTKRERVQRAIRSLLGLGVIEDAIKHVRRAAADVNKLAKEVGGGTDLRQIATRLELIDDESVKLETQLEDSKQQFRTMDELQMTSSSVGILGWSRKASKDLEGASREIRSLMWN
jgi:DNA sulfur modification protein DndD